MPEIQIISHRGRTAAIVAGDNAIISQHVPDELLAHVQAKALYALQIQSGELPGPFTDAGAERYARTAAAGAPPAPRERPQPGRAGRGASHRRRHR